ncbi:hypothetical protein CEUSTIGMA_g5521.t1 [Chlamydomonas eustigma]|uniref:Methyltransferase small domain-containing protein n=1 Tax=Chlamydomonas eustigma TaxID=1157962 RepID=A0A250X585_9CHLO|nr:hypothetical protein CEUSTIGMA_g5521.t1 [Chlamydomonas eustigma]|eukprot:GAX78079.1 hypothetical protein CEUSTIGMA_g5521.t1 [Chlamydomonas eustigma]
MTNPLFKQKHIFISAEVEECKVIVARKNLEYEDEQVDFYLFEPDYTIAGSTGFLLWPGSWILIDLLKGALGTRLHGRRVIELGSGTGLAGLCAAAAGAHVLMTDLPSVVHGILADNVKRNADQRSQNAWSSEQSPPFDGQRGNVEAEHPVTADSYNRAPKSWASSAFIGKRGGSAACMPLDWSEPLLSQVENATRNLQQDVSKTEALIACDVVWLKELLHPFRDTVIGILRLCAPATPFFLTFIDRAKGTGTGNFSSRDEVAALFSDMGCHVQTYCVKENVQIDGEYLHAEVMEIFLEKECV